MNTRYVIHKPIPKARLRDFVALDNLTAQLPLIEIIHIKNIRKHIRIWTAYDPERENGTYTAVYFDGLVETITRYPSGVTHTRMNRPPDAETAKSDSGAKQTASRSIRKRTGKRNKRSLRST